MDELIVNTNKLQSKYCFSNFLWNLFIKRFLLWIANGWKSHPIVAFPLMIDIEVGNIKLHYFKYGFVHVLNRVNKYNNVLIERMKNEEEELLMEDFTRIIKLTKKADIEAQIELEFIKENEY